MKPVQFPEANVQLHAPSGMEDEVSVLPVCRTEAASEGSDKKHVYHISCWNLSLWERLTILFRGRLWLWVMSYAHPPVSIDTRSPWRKQTLKRLAALGSKVPIIRLWKAKRDIAEAVRQAFKEGKQ